jgi:hypothetical protein
MNRRCPALLALSISILAAPACGGSSPPPTEAAAPRAPGDVYTDYVSAVGNAGSAREVYPFLSSAAQKRVGGDVEALKARSPGGRLKIMDEQIKGERATVIVSATIQDKKGKEQPSTGTVLLVREGGGWKVDQESWVAQ